MSSSSLLPSFLSRLALRADPSLDPVTTPMVESSLVSFFHNYPRFGLPRDVELTGRYFFGAATTAIPWVVVGVVCLVLATCATALCGPLRNVKHKARRRAAREEAAADDDSGEVARRSSSVSSRRMGQLVFSVVLFNVAFWLIGFGFVASFFFFEGVKDTFLAIGYGVDGVYGASVIVSEFSIDVLDRLSGNAVIAALVSTLVPSIDSTKAQAQSFVETNSKLLDQTRGYLRTARIAGIVVYVVLLILFLSLLGFLFAVFSVQARGKRSKRSVGRTMCLMLVPLVLSWFAVGFVSVASVLTADMCGQLGGYHRIILDQAAEVTNGFSADIDRSKNILFSNGVECPKNLVDEGVLDALQLFTSGITGGTLVDTALGALYPGQDTTGVSEFSTNFFEGIESCSSMVRFAGRMHQSVCQPSGPLLGLFVIWFCLILLALLLTTTFFVSQYSSLDTTRFYTPRHFGKAAAFDPHSSDSDEDGGEYIAQDIENTPGYAWDSHSQQHVEIADAVAGTNIRQ